MKRNFKRNKGITLIALVVTIVILIILAVISINAVLGENGLIQQAERAAEFQANAEASDNEAMDKYDKYVANAIAGNDVTVDNEGSTEDGENDENTDNDGNQEEDGSGDLEEPELPEEPKVEKGGDTHTATTLSYSWSELNEIAKAISNTNLREYVVEEGEITNDTVEVKVTIGEKTYTVGIGDKVKIGGNTVKIIGFNHDLLTDTSAYEQSGIKNEYAGITFEYASFITTTKSQMNSEATNKAGWGASAMRTTVNDFKDTVETAMGGKYIKQVKKKYGYTYNSNGVSTSNDYLWLLSCSEIWSTGEKTHSNSGLAYNKEGNQYKWYKEHEDGISYADANENFCKPLIFSGGSYFHAYCWLRSSSYYSAEAFCVLNDYGQCDCWSADTVAWIFPGFCL